MLCTCFSESSYVHNVRPKTTEKILKILCEYQEYRFETQFGITLAKFYNMDEAELQTLMTTMYEYYLTDNPYKNLLFLVPYIDSFLHKKEFKFLDDMFKYSLRYILRLNNRDIKYVLSKRKHYMNTQVKPTDNNKFVQFRL